MLYSIQSLLHKVGLLGKPGAEHGEVDKGAASDRTNGQVTEHGSGPTNIESIPSQNSGVRALDEKLLKAARIHIEAGLLEVDSQFSFARKYVSPSQLVPLTAYRASGNPRRCTVDRPRYLHQQARTAHGHAADSLARTRAGPIREGGYTR